MLGQTSSFGTIDTARKRGNFNARVTDRQHVDVGITASKSTKSSNEGSEGKIHVQAFHRAPDDVFDGIHTTFRELVTSLRFKDKQLNSRSVDVAVVSQSVHGRARSTSVTRAGGDVGVGSILGRKLARRDIHGGRSTYQG